MGSGKNNTSKRERFLKNLGVGSPKIFWEMYRDLLLHNNGVHAVAVGNKGVQPLIVYTDEADEALFDGRPTTMNVGQVYRNLMKYLDAKIEEADDEAIEEVPHAFRYNKDSDDPIVKALAAEIERVHDGLMDNSTT